MVCRSEEVDQALELGHLVVLVHLPGLEHVLLFLLVYDPRRELHFMAPSFARLDDVEALRLGIIRPGCVAPRVEPALHDLQKQALLLKGGTWHVLEPQRRVLHSELSGLLHVHLCPDCLQKRIILVQGSLVLHAPVDLAPAHTLWVDGVEDRQNDEGEAGLKFERRLDIHLEDPVQPEANVAILDFGGRLIDELLCARLDHLLEHLFPLRRLEAGVELADHLEAQQGRSRWPSVLLLLLVLLIIRP
mmetsp:Transcript_68518/g.139373  ORF Transcript_68518/g.139373 Transcript_68518/m.139373 type:complete len:246 (+) Transcript_68518:194-931(+)